MKEGYREGELDNKKVTLLHEHLTEDGEITRQIQEGAEEITFGGQRARILVVNYRFFDQSEHEVVDSGFPVGNQAADHIVELLE